MSEKRKAGTQPKSEKPESGAAQDVTFVVNGVVLQRTVELLAGLPLQHPVSMQRDQLIAYFTQLKAEDQSDDGSRTN